MQEHDWDSFVDTLINDNTMYRHAQSVQSPLSVVCEMPPAYYCQPLIALPVSAHGTYGTERSACILQPAASPPTTPATCSSAYAARYPCSPAHVTCSPVASPTASATVATRL